MPPAEHSDPRTDPRTLVLFDGVCGLCHGVVQFLITRDHLDRLRFAPLQGPTAASILTRYGNDPADLDTIYVLKHPDTPREQIYFRARGVLVALSELGGAWRIVGALRYLPAGPLNLGYRAVARVRYRIFGKLDACPVPTPAQRAKFAP